MTTAAAHTALRMALRSMLADLTYPTAQKSQGWVEDRLGEAAWSDTITDQLKALAIRWATTQGERVSLTVRKALGEEIPDEVFEAYNRKPLHGSTPRSGPTTGEDMYPVSVDATDPARKTLEHAMDTTHGTHDTALVELHRQAEFMNCPPWNTPPKKHADALRAVEAGKVREAADAQHVWEVCGSKGTWYIVDQMGCTCPHGQRSNKTKWGCYHAVAVELYRRWQRELQPGLFAAPKTIDERLALTPQNDAQPTIIPQEDIQPMAQPETSLEAPSAPQTAPATPDAPPMLDEAKLHSYRQTIARQLATLGHKPKDRAAYEDTIMSLVGLVLAPENFPLIAERLSEIITTRTRQAPAPIPEHWLVDIKGKQHILFAGLLAMAHERGLLTLAADFISVTADLALARATATFQDGRTFSEAADATPGNVGPQVKPHFARMALTRAKARVLRDALNINAVSAEEVE